MGQPTKSHKILRRHVVQFCFHALLIATLQTLALAQEADDDMVIVDFNTTMQPTDDMNTIQPTIIFIATPNPSESPSAPTFGPSFAPSSTPSTNQPSANPSTSPSISLAPSYEPSTTFQPSDQPSLSLEPSISNQPSFEPSNSPSQLPSLDPSSGPSGQPTVTQSPTSSQMPTLSLVPTISLSPSLSPTLLPSDIPSGMPSQSQVPSSMPSSQPSGKPSLSQAPSFEPSLSASPSISNLPSFVPSNAPTDFPTDNPSAGPSTPLPSQQPSWVPSYLPSISMSPNSMAPTFAERTIVQGKIVMFLGGIPLLNPIQQAQWVNATQNHIFRYYDSINTEVPGILPGLILQVYDTEIFDQSLESTPLTPSSFGFGPGSAAGAIPNGLEDPIDPLPGDDPSTLRLAIEYTQSIDYEVVTGSDLEELEEFELGLFTAPFAFDADSYIVDLITLWELEEWIDSLVVVVGDTDSPTLSPTEDDDEPSQGETRLSQKAVRAISASIVLSSILLVAFLFWDRHRKEKMYMQTHARDFDTMEHDNTGQPVDWSNPFANSNRGNNTTTAANNSSNTAATGGGINMNNPTPQSTLHGREAGGSGSGSGSRNRRRSNSPQPTVSSSGFASSTVASGRSNRNLPPLPQYRSGSMRSAGQVDLPGPPVIGDHNRHTSIADTEITDITYSDGQGGGRSDTGSEGGGFPAIGSGLPALPTISDDHFGERVPWSPLEIPDEENYGAALDSPDVSDLNMAPSMSGFQMQVEELE